MFPSSEFFSQFLHQGFVFSHPTENKVWVAVGGEFLASPKDKFPCFYVNNFFLQSPLPWYCPGILHEMDLATLQEQLGKQEQKKPEISWKTSCFKDYQNQFESLKELIVSGHLVKGVPYAQSCTSGDMDPCALSYCLSQAILYAQKTQTFLYGFWQGEEGVLGVTPEILFRQEGRHISTMALAGSRENKSFVKERKEAMLCDAKLREEHDVVIDGILARLQGLGKSTILGTDILELPRILHLKTEIDLALYKETDFATLLQCLHPTPALGAWPLGGASQSWLASCQERTPRGYHGAPFALCFAERALCLVAIRNIQWQRGEIKIVAGGGVTAQSSLSQEWQEILCKIEAVKAIFNLSDGST